MPQNIAIFGAPRSATKLLASIYVQQGYFNCGEFFDTATNAIVQSESSPPHAKRIHRSDQLMLREQMWDDADQYKKDMAVEGARRESTFVSAAMPQPNTVTVWVNDMLRAPTLVKTLADRYFICPRREDRFEQLISNAVAWRNLNYDGDIVSSPIIIRPSLLDYLYSTLTLTEMMQDAIVGRGLGQFVDFDKLINGTEQLGFNYKVTSVDEHASLPPLVSNLQQVKERFNWLVRQQAQREPLPQELHLLQLLQQYQ